MIQRPITASTKYRISAQFWSGSNLQITPICGPISAVHLRVSINPLTMHLNPDAKWTRSPSSPPPVATVAPTVCTLSP
jgi:hypothetical protein